MCAASCKKIQRNKREQKINISTQYKLNAFKLLECTLACSLYEQQKQFFFCSVFCFLALFCIVFSFCRCCCCVLSPLHIISAQRYVRVATSQLDEFGFDCDVSSVSRLSPSTPCFVHHFCSFFFLLFLRLRCFYYLMLN